MSDARSASFAVLSVVAMIGGDPFWSTAQAAKAKPANPVISPAEFEVMKTHTTIGAELLSGGSSALMQMAEEIALYHHERWDGTGYPTGLSGDRIPLPARIVSIADVFDALTHPRPYRSAWPAAEVMAHITGQSGRLFMAIVVHGIEPACQ